MPSRSVKSRGRGCRALKSVGASPHFAFARFVGLWFREGRHGVLRVRGKHRFLASPLLPPLSAASLRSVDSARVVLLPVVVVVVQITTSDWSARHSRAAASLPSRRRNQDRRIRHTPG